MLKLTNQDSWAVNISLPCLEHISVEFHYPKIFSSLFCKRISPSLFVSLPFYSKSTILRKKKSVLLKAFTNLLIITRLLQSNDSRRQAQSPSVKECNMSFCRHRHVTDATKTKLELKFISSLYSLAVESLLAVVVIISLVAMFFSEVSCVLLKLKAC